MGLGVKKRGRPARHTIQHHALQQAIDILGSPKRLALEVGVPYSKISAWLYGREKIPAHHVPKIVQATQGRVASHELRSDVFGLLSPIVFSY